MSHRYVNLLRSIFHDPPSRNLDWRDIESLLKHVGWELEPIAGARIRVRLNGVEGVLHRMHHGHTLDAGSLMHLRTLLARAGVTPSQYEAKNAAPPPGPQSLK